MAEARHRERKSTQTAQKKERSLWAKLKGSALFWLAMIVGFAAIVVVGIVLLSKLLSGA